MRVAQSAEARPTDQIHTVFKRFSDDLDVQLRALDDVVAQDVTRFNALLASSKLEAIK